MKLEEFLSLPASNCDKDPRPYNFHTDGVGWIDRYRIAKGSYIRFGDDGPPIGSIVKTLASGHGGGPGLHKKFGLYESDSRFFSLTWEHAKVSAGREDYGCSLVERAFWWREIQLAESFATVLHRGLYGFFSEKDLKDKFPQYCITNKLVTKWLQGQLLHWDRDNAIRIWMREKGVIC